MKTLEDLYELTGLDKLEWEVTSFECRAYEGFFKNKNIQQAEVVQMFSVSCKAKRIIGGSVAKIEIERIKNELLSTARGLPIVPNFFTRSYREASELMAVAVPNDMHFGKLCYGKETGYGDFDLEIAEKIWDEGFLDLVSCN